MTAEQLKQLLQTAVDAALAAAVPIRRYFDSGQLGIQEKGDGSPVTLADQEAEAVIRTHLLSRASVPLDILGEEEGLIGHGTRWRWTVDPIDGTRSFIHGIPLFGTMIGLQDTKEQRALLGVLHLPMLELTYAGGLGLGVTCNGKRVRFRREAVALADSIVGVGDVAQFVAAKREEDYRRLVAVHGYVRGYTDCFGHGLVVSGAVDAMLDPTLNPWDIVPTQALIEELGGKTILRPSQVPGKVDTLFGNRALVEQIARELAF